MPPKNPGGRPKKYATKAEAKAADLEKRQYRRQQARLPAGPADFIAFEPPHPDVPTDTPPSGLRTSSGIRIPADSNVQSSDVPQNLRPISPPPTQLPPFDEDAEVAAQIKQIQVDEQEVNLERGEYEAEIAEILIGLRSANAAEEARTGGRGSPGKRPMEGSNTVGEGEDARNEEPQRSCSSQIASVDEPIMTWDNDSTAASNTSNRPASIQRSPENTVPPQTPTQHKSPPLPSSNRTSSNGSTGRRSTPFPAQKNNLLSWMKPLATRSPAKSTSSPPAIEKPPSDASPSPFRRIESFAPSSPAQSVIQTTPDPATSTPMPASAPAATDSPAPIVPQHATASPAPRASPNATVSPAPIERTAFKLAKQLRNFQGCTHEQHREADESHQEHHRRPGVHSKCSSLQQISNILRGNCWRAQDLYYDIS